ncbi:MAG: hypothetical protein GY723_13290 [bacterium]|nr:hypothetical protein [bacterium]
MSRHPILKSILLLGALTALGCAPSQRNLGDWQVEIGPAGNEIVQVRESSASQEMAPPPDRLFDIVRVLTPAHMQVGEWYPRRDGAYGFVARAETERYNITLTPAGEIIEIEYNDDSAGIREKAYAMILRGKKRPVALDELPARSLATLAELAPDAEVTQAWHAETTAGPRYVIVAGESAFYARADGQIQSARRIAEGALEENYPRGGDRNATITAIRDEAEIHLAAHRERFDYGRQIAALGQVDRGPAKPFRFVVMGDSRSNPAFWPLILDHIASLEHPPRFVINTGDLVPRGFVDEFRDYFVTPLLDKEYFYFTALGNHDCGYEGLATEYRSLFGENSLNFHFDHGAYRFIFIDTVTRLIPMADTIAWLGELLAATPAERHVVAVTHKPFRNIEQWAYHSLDLESSEAITALLSRHEVGHVFLGHIHAYSTATFAGVDYTVSGGGGAGLHDRFGRDGSVHHYIIVDAQPDGTLEQQVVRFREPGAP